MPRVEIVPVEAHVSMLRLNRPERLNAIDFDLVGELHDALDTLAADADCRVIIFTGAGRGFCAGLDLKDWGEAPGPGEHAQVHAGIDAQTFMSNLAVHFQRTPQVILAAVNGPAFGGGLALACSSDIRIAARSARFCSASIRTGLSGCECGLTYLLPRLIGNARAFDLILTGRDIDADEAHQLGIVSRVVDDADLDRVVLEEARRMAGYTGAGLRATKEVLWHNTEAPDLTTALALEIRTQNLLQHDPEVTAYMAAYREGTTGTRRQR